MALDNVSLIYCLLVNRVRFLRDATHTLSLHSISATRASLCETLATNILLSLYEKEMANHHPSATHALIPIAKMLVAGFSPFQGAPSQVLDDLKQMRGEDCTNHHKRLGKGNSLEMAIVSEAKKFIRWCCIFESHWDRLNF